MRKYSDGRNILKRNVLRIHEKSKRIVYSLDYIMIYLCYDHLWVYDNFPAYIYLFKMSNRNTRKMCETCSKLTIKTSKRRRELESF